LFFLGLSRNAFVAKGCALERKIRHIDTSFALRAGIVSKCIDVFVGCLTNAARGESQ
jgi:hypothetical protein